ncbi:response regulator transcription factor [Rubritalea tangerina]|uniref:Response regulator transcription factor n=2 Tax=Rubritalea tangerina TaxID=430798 RepID=A0ABW4ZD70_9BACT
MHLLVVEHNTLLCERLQKLFEADGAHVVCSATVEEGLACLSEQAFDACVIEHALPAMDGMQMLVRLRERGDYTPIILLSYEVGAQFRVQGFDAGADGVLIHPFEEAELAARVRSLVRRNHGHCR